MIKIDGSAKLDEPMTAHSSFRIGGSADLYVVPANADEAADVLRLCARESIPSFVIGGGTNILVSDLGIRGVVVDMSRLVGIRAVGSLVVAQGGTPVSDVAEFALARFRRTLFGQVPGAWAARRG